MTFFVLLTKEMRLRMRQERTVWVLIIYVILLSLLGWLYLSRTASGSVNLGYDWNTTGTQLYQLLTVVEILLIRFYHIYIRWNAYFILARLYTIKLGSNITILPTEFMLCQTISIESHPYAFSSVQKKVQEERLRINHLVDLAKYGIIERQSGKDGMDFWRSIVLNILCMQRSGCFREKLVKKRLHFFSSVVKLLSVTQIESPIRKSYYCAGMKVVLCTLWLQ